MDSAKQSAQAHAAKGGITCPANAMHFSCHLAPWGYQSHDQSEYMHCESLLLAVSIVHLFCIECLQCMLLPLTDQVLASMSCHSSILS